MSRPCRYCLAAYPILFEGGSTTDCEWTHRDDPRVYGLAAKLASVFQQRSPTDEQIAWFLADADAVVDDFEPAPEKWRVRNLPLNRYDEFDMKFRLNDVTYVIQSGGHKEVMHPVRLSVLRGWQREANEAARLREGSPS